MTARAGRWYAVEGTTDRYEMLTDGAGIVALERQSYGVWWLRTPRDPHGCRAVNLGSGSVRAAKARARAMLALRASDRVRR